MNQLKDDVQKFYAWARKEYEGEEIERLIFDVHSAITNLERLREEERFRRLIENFKADLIHAYTNRNV